MTRAAVLHARWVDAVGALAQLDADGCLQCRRVCTHKRALALKQLYVDPASAVDSGQWGLRPLAMWWPDELAQRDRALAPGKFPGHPTASAPPPVVAVPAPVAEASPPAVCGDVAEREILDEAMRGLAAADAGDVQSYAAATRNLKNRPAECRPVLERLQPVALLCSEAEANALMHGTSRFAEASAAGNVQEFLAIYDRIEQAVTPACWQAMHRHSHPVVVSACSTEDLDRLATHAPEVLRATMIAAVSLDTGRMLQVQATMVSLMQSLPSPCLDAIQSANKPQPGGPSAGGGMPGVYEHGAGAYSVPGVAYCGASGCVAL